MWQARLFVATIFLVLTTGFLLSTWTFVRTFAEGDWRSLLLMHSHQFLFFPTFGILALIAFYIPAVVFTHMYWTRRVKRGAPRLRFLGGFALAVLGAIFFATLLDGSNVLWPSEARRALWELPPKDIAFTKADVSRAQLPLTDRPDGPRSRPCDRQGAPSCRNASPPEVAALLRSQSLDNLGFSRLVRDCDVSPLVELTDAEKAPRFCFPARQWLSLVDCCAHQARFQSDLADRAKASVETNPIVRLERWILPLKVFFVLILLAIAVMLVVWRTVLDTHYRQHSRALSRGLVVGALAMLTWPLMDYGYYQTSQLLYGDGTARAGWPYRLSLVMLPWAAIITYYFLNRLLTRPSRRLELSVQIISAVVGFVTFFGGSAVMNVSQRYANAGAYAWTIELCVGLSVLGVVYLLWRAAVDRRRGVDRLGLNARDGDSKPA